ncbi:EscU/YscU/HrcU family type III secretion system export apparatus switch protein [Pararhodobacter zhoushanensis]|uniref:Flagellar type III secretion system protein FlhB n=1 Tax=Pararhodobacter zhoushanensis TaxID=2479545 RepID=A0ABT3H0W9_9RHOB|nr:flagellar type III secretion system protein FlhB [Pararhodobacter zhoushanensis]MCW1933439.1 flagellar type III secretion system protein FlhB [Pararhodobacter zhoushanensis]
MSEDDGADRPHEATPRKLDEARRKGDMPRTTDLTAAAAAAGFLALVLLPGGWVPPRIGTIGANLLDRADSIAPVLLGGGSALGGTLLSGIGAAMAPAMLIPGLCALAVLFALRGIVFAPEKLSPKLSRISPLSNAKNKFGLSGLMEFAKSALKLLIYATLLWLFLTARLPELMLTIGQSPGQATVAMLSLMAEFWTLVVVIMVAIGALDHLWQVFDHSRKQRMSHQELREDHKQAEGDPHVKQQRRQRAHEIATNQMLAAVPTAAVVVVNPTHYAVALAWTPGSTGAPVCVAKGVDEIAARIREAAQEAGVPIHSDPPTARALHATVELGREISPDHYRPVAAAIRFADAMRSKVRARQGSR